MDSKHTVVNLKRPVIKPNFDINLCIFCQSHDDTQPLYGTSEGRGLILEAAKLKQDSILEILQCVDFSKIVYHTKKYQCYKQYTRKRDIDKLKEEQDQQVKSTDDHNLYETRKNKKARHSSSSQTPMNTKNYSNLRHLMDIKCIICNCFKHAGTYYKYRISENDSAAGFLDATLVLQDEVYVRTCNVNDIFAADLYYHSTCYKAYMRKFTSEVQRSKIDGSQTNRNKKQDLIQNIIEKEVHPILSQGKGITLSAIRDHVNSQGDNIIVSNKELKLFLCKKYGDDVHFMIPSAPNKPMIAYLKSVVDMDGVIQTICSTNAAQDCAAAVRESLKQTDFGLTDKFMDATELKESWDSINIPEPVLTFLSVLTNCDLKASDNYDANDENTENEQANSIVKKKRKALALFQIMAYIVNNGEQKPPLQVMISQSIHETCKSKTLIECVNRLGLGVSYDELLRYHANMAKLTAQVSGGHRVPLPSHFTKDQFTTAAVDNFDHEEDTLSGKGGTHDTVTVLFQNESFIQPSKPSVSESGIMPGTRNFNVELSCQERGEFIKPARKPSFPETFRVCETIEEMTEKTKHYDNIDRAWQLSRLDLEAPACPIQQQQEMPSWSAFNSVVSNEQLPKKTVGFLPVLPFPVTEYSSVYTALTNLKDVLSQLNQEYLPIGCDEGVYNMIRTVQMYRPNEFSKLVPILGTFHMEKVLIGVIGKFLAGSGADIILTETGVFGPNVAKLALAGKHYTRGIRGIQLLSEAMERLRYSQFFKTARLEKYENEKKVLKNLKENTAMKNHLVTKDALQQFEATSELVNDFQKFVEQGKQSSETFKYWSQFIELACLLRNLIRADRLGDWKLHVHCVSEAIPYFQAFDNINYTRWASVYIEDMKNLEDTAPEVFNHFMEGDFVVKRSSGTFCATAIDMALEQTINRSQKSAGGIIGKTRCKKAVTEWEVIYHEMLAVFELFRIITATPRSVSDELTLHHEFTTKQTESMNEHVNNMVKFIEKHENPFEPNKEPTLHNILTQEMMPEEVRKDLLCAQDIGKERYEAWRNDVFVQKTTSITDVIHRTNLKTFKSAETIAKSNISQQSQKKKKRQSAQASKTIDVARSRSYDMMKLFQYDISDHNYLFDSDGLMVKPDKYMLVHGMEKKYLIKATDYKCPTDWNTELKTAYLVDAMAYARKVSTAKEKTFGSMCDTIIKMIDAIALHASRIDYVFDTYIEGSVKDTERSRRATVRPIEINSLTSDTPIQTHMEYFWASGNNKQKFQELLREHIVTHSGNNPMVDYVVSGTTGHTPTYCISVKTGAKHNLDVDVEEADQRIVPHLLDCAKNLHQRVAVLSPDTDVFVLLVYYMKILRSNGLYELYMRAGSGNTTRYLPIHIIAMNAGDEVCDSLPALHALTGSDMTSKVGTKTSALEKPDINLLKDFGKDHQESSLALDETYKNAEEFLVHVLKPSSHLKTMDELRHWEYHHSKAALGELPPTSRSLKFHLDRGFYSVFLQTHLLNSPPMRVLDPKMYGFELEDSALIPTKGIFLEPDDLLKECNCVKCSTVRCSCRVGATPCIEYCRCQSVIPATCRNPLNIIIEEVVTKATI